MPGYTLDDGVTHKNKFGATNPVELARLEAPSVAIRSIEIQEGFGPPRTFDIEHYKSVHRHLFQDVDEWAGRTREERVVLSDGEIATMPLIRKPGSVAFVAGPLIPTTLDRIFRELRAADDLRGLDRPQFADRAADLFADLNAVHPFREGNGRTQRAFLAELAIEAGHSLDFDVISTERMIKASIAAHDHGDRTAFRRMFREISDPDRVLALREAQVFFERHHFAWRDHYIATTEQGQTYNLVMVGRSSRNFIGRTEDTILIGTASDLPKPAPAIGDTFMLTIPRADHGIGDSGRSTLPRP